MKKILLVGAMFFAGAVAAFGQAFPNYPTIGVPANTECLSYGNNNVCNQYRPAGPTNLAPTATVPADTNYSNGNMPQTVRVPAGLLGAVAVDAAPLTGTSITVAAGTSKLMLNPAGTIAALTVVLPPATSLVDGQSFNIYSTQTVTALTVTAGTGTTIVPTITTVTAAAPIRLVYSAAGAKWLLG